MKDSIIPRSSPYAPEVKGGRTLQPGPRRPRPSAAGSPFTMAHAPAFPLTFSSSALADARLHGSAVVAVPVTDTVKRADSDAFISATVPREGLWAVQTPQVFPFSVLQRAYREVSENVTDDASMVERLGVKIKLTPGSPTNLKVTNPEDLELAEMILKSRVRASGR